MDFLMIFFVPLWMENNVGDFGCDLEKYIRLFTNDVSQKNGFLDPLQYVTQQF